MVVVPALTAVTTPSSSMVATPVLELVHGLLLAGVPLPSKSVVASTHTVVVPLIVGNVFTVTVKAEVVAAMMVAGGEDPSTSNNKHRYVPASVIATGDNVKVAVVAVLIFSYSFEVVFNFCH